MAKLFDGEEKFSAKLKSLRTLKALSRECFTSWDENKVDFSSVPLEMLILMISISRAHQKSSSIAKKRSKRAQKRSFFSFDFRYRNRIVNKCRMAQGNLFINYSALFPRWRKHSNQHRNNITIQFIHFSYWRFAYLMSLLLNVPYL